MRTLIGPRVDLGSGVSMAVSLTPADISRIRRSYGMSIRAFARALDVCYSVVWRAEHAGPTYRSKASQGSISLADRIAQLQLRRGVL